MRPMIRIGLYGVNGHQLLQAFPGGGYARIVAAAAVPDDKLPADVSIRRHDSLDGILDDPEVDLVSLCSPRRAGQAAEAVRALRAGKHVLAEKPCALTEPDLDAILLAAGETGRTFHEMAGTAFGQPYCAMREIVQRGLLGEVVQVIAEKSYPYYDGRPQDEDIDGGLIAQNAIHALRFVEHVALTPIHAVRAVATSAGNPVGGGGLRMAASLMLSLRNGGVASISANYLNPAGTGVWGDESLKILGTAGFVESRAGGRLTRLVIGGADRGPLKTEVPGLPWLECVFLSILEKGPMPISLEEELSPTRWAIRARASAERGLE